MKRRFEARQFDSNTFQVVDKEKNNEVCVTGRYDEETASPEVRAKMIAFALNQSLFIKEKPIKIKVCDGVVTEVSGLGRLQKYIVVECDKCGKQIKEE